MPIYEYRCTNGHQFEVFQSISDEPVSACQECGAPVERVFHPVAVHFKGSGFYTTDYARKTSSKPSDSTDGKKAKDSGSDSKPDKETKKTETASSSSKDD
jgi:putative FmdB family regulatory protein